MDLLKIQDYLSGKASPQDALEVQMYLAEHMDDPEIAAILESQFDSCRAEDKNDGALISTRSRLGLEGRKHYKLWTALAAALLLLVSLPLAFRAGSRSHHEPEAVVWQEITVPVAQTRILRLPDGSTLALNAGSRVTWPDRFQGGSREIFLDGEVMANVAHDPETPFIIHCGEVNVRVHGTSFDLKAYRDATMMEVMLKEGSVSMDIPSVDGRREVKLTPGDIAQFDRSEGGVTLSRVSAEGYKNFADNGALSFINTPLSDIVADLERVYGAHLIVADPSIASQRFLAFFTNGESLEEILRLLSVNGGLRYVRRSETIYIYKK